MRRTGAALVLLAVLATAAAVAASAGGAHRASPTKLTIWVGWSARELGVFKKVVAELSRQLAAARKDSSTSSKPPSSDIVKPPKPPPPEGQDRRHAGGQPGHPKHERAAFPPEAVNGGFFDYYLDACPACGKDLHPALTIAPRVVQQVDIGEVPLSIAEHRSHPAWCPRCHTMYEAPLPLGIARGGLVGPSLTTLIAYLKGACHASFSTIRNFVQDGAQDLRPADGNGSRRRQAAAVDEGGDGEGLSKRFLRHRQFSMLAVPRQYIACSGYGRPRVLLTAS